MLLATDYTFATLQNAHVAMSSLVFRGETLGRWPGQKGGTLVSGNGTLLGPQSTLSPFHHGKAQ